MNDDKEELKQGHYTYKKNKNQPWNNQKNLAQ